MSGVNRDERLRPLTAIEWLVCVIAAVGFAFDIYEILMLPLIVRPAILELTGAVPGSAEFQMWVGRLFYVPAFAGGLLGLVGGYLTDRFGRRRVLTYSILVYAVGAFASGYATSIEMLLVLRCLVFAGVCVEFVAAVAWLAELFPHPRRREKVLGYTQAFSSLGGLMVAFASSLAASYGALLPAIGGFGLEIQDPHAPWRYTLMSGVLPAIPLILIRPFLPESPVWQRKRAAGTLERPSLAALFAPEFRRTTIVTTLMFAMSYGAAFGAIQQLPQIVPGLPDVQAMTNDAPPAGARAIEQRVASDMTKVQELGGLTGRILLAWLAVVVVSRRLLIRIFQVPGLLIFPVVFGWAATESLAWLTIGAFMAALVTVGQFSFWGNYLPRVYPVHLRGTGESFAANIGGRLIGTSFAWITATLAVTPDRAAAPASTSSASSPASGCRNLRTRTSTDMKLHTRILIGLGVGATLGAAANLTVGPDHPAIAAINEYVAVPVGQIFLRMLFMVVMPLVFASIALGVAGLGDIRQVGRVGGKAVGYFIATTALAATLGLIVVNALAPWDHVEPQTRVELMDRFAGEAATRVQASESGGFGPETIVNIVPRNPVEAAARTDMLGVIFFGLMFGAALTLIPRERARPMVEWLEALNDVVTRIIHFAMLLAPLGVAALIFAVASRFGMDLLIAVAAFVGTVLLALLLHVTVTLFAIIRFGLGLSPRLFLSRTRAALVTAFSTSSSSATLPTALEVVDRQLGVPRGIAGFVLPIGSTMCMNGTAIFEGITVIFLAEVFGVDLSVPQMVVVMIMSVITAIGAAGVPGGSIPLLVGILTMFGVPGEGIAIVLGVDRILDMSRTTVNVAGDLTATLWVARSEGLWTPESVPPAAASARPEPPAAMERTA